MNLFGEIADELTDIIEELDASPYAELASALQKTLQKAFEQACVLDRTVEARGAVAESTHPHRLASQRGAKAASLTLVKPVGMAARCA